MVAVESSAQGKAAEGGLAEAEVTGVVQAANSAEAELREARGANLGVMVETEVSEEEAVLQVEEAPWGVGVKKAAEALLAEGAQVVVRARVVMVVEREMATE